MSRSIVDDGLSGLVIISNNKPHPNHRDIKFAKKGSNGIEDDFAFTDDVLTACYEKQEAALKVLKKKHGKNYGMPKKGSMTDKRGKKYQKSVNEEAVDLCSMIAIQGSKNKDGSIWVRFGELFRVYQFISNKVVGIMHRARKNRLIHFDGETLWQGKDDHATVTLLLPFSEIQAYLLKTGKLLLNKDPTYIVVRDLHHTHLLHMKYATTLDLPFEECESFPVFETNPKLANVSEEANCCTNITIIKDAPTVSVCPEARKYSIARANRGIERPVSRIVLDFGSSSLVNSAIMQRKECTDYVKAAFVNSFKQPNEFIVTEWPTKETLGDFWSLIYDHNVKTIVVLDRPKTSDKFPAFWPDSGCMEKYDKVLQTKSVGCETSDVDWNRWKINLQKEDVPSDCQDPSDTAVDLKTCNLFQVTGWLEGKKVPSSPQTIIRLVERCRGSGEDTHMVIVSKDGCARAGLFCATAFIKDKIQRGADVDVMSVVKNVRTNRQQLVSNNEEYKFCYDIADELALNERLKF